MITIKLPYNTTENFNAKINCLQSQYSNIARLAYKQFTLNKPWGEVLTYCIKYKKDLSSYIISTAVQEAMQIYNKHKSNKIIFGGKHNFILRCKNKITKEEYYKKRLLPLAIQGETTKHGNRHFNLNIIDDNQIVFKLNRKEHYILTLPNLGKQYKTQLERLQLLNEKDGYKYSIKLTNTHIFISFEEFKHEQINLNVNRYIGIDLNPDTIGVSVLENDKVIHAVEYSLNSIFGKILSEKLSSNSDRMKYFQNKLKFETLQISKSISNLANHYNCKSVFIEDLHFKDASTIKISNRKNKNLWKRELFINNLTKRLNIFNIKLYSVNPAYSSFIGNLMYDYTDAVNASIEIARRGFEYRIKKNKTGFFPNLLVKHQWKEMATKYTDWKKFFLEVKNLKIKYRVSLNEVKFSYRVFSLNNKKSKINLYTFY